MKIGADFRHNGRTSEDMANRRARADLARGIGLSTSRNGVLIVLRRDSSGEFKIAEIRDDFGYCGTASEDMAICPLKW